eukprot:scaffold264557_cov29-Attheya_sp.AAC.1
MGDWLSSPRGLVDRVPWRVWCMWSNVVITAFVKCFRTASTVSLGHDLNAPRFIAFIQVDWTGLKHAA